MTNQKTTAKSAPPSNAAQISFLKRKLGDFIKRHKLIVVTIQKKYKEQLTKIIKVGLRYKQISKTMKRKLTLEKEKSGREIAQNRAEIIFLQSELQRERNKNLELMNNTPQAIRQPVEDRNSQELEALKDAAYAKAQIDSLRQELKNEIAKSAKIAANADARIAVLEEEVSREKEKNLNSDKRSSEKIAALEEELRKQIAEITKTNEGLSLQNNNLSEENKRNAEEIKDKTNTIARLEDELAQAMQEIAKLKADIIALNEKHIEDTRLKNVEITKLNKHIRGIQNHAQKIYRLNRTYDVFKIYDDINFLKKRVGEEIKFPEKSKMLTLLEDIDKQGQIVRLYEKKVEEKLANFENDLSDVLERVNNFLYNDEVHFQDTPSPQDESQAA